MNKRFHKNKKIFFAYSVFFVSLFFLHSCDFFDRAVVIKMDKAAFQRERNLWNSQNIGNYRFVYDFFNDAGPLGPVRVTVKENEEPVVENQNEFNSHVIARNIPEIYDFISDAFDFIESVRNGSYSGHRIRSITLNITYNTQFHYPVKVSLTAGYVESVDGGVYYTLNITEFSPLD